MAWCLTAPSHYLNQCWLIISKVPRHSSEGIIIRSADINRWNKIENCILKIKSRSPWGQCVNKHVIQHIIMSYKVKMSVDVSWNVLYSVTPSRRSPAYLYFWLHPNHPSTPWQDTHTLKFASCAPCSARKKWGIQRSKASIRAHIW